MGLGYSNPITYSEDNLIVNSIDGSVASVCMRLVKEIHLNTACIAVDDKEVPCFVVTVEYSNGDTTTFRIHNDPEIQTKTSMLIAISTAQRNARKQIVLENAQRIHIQHDNDNL